ncbi:hypothetical protein K0A97_02225 [Patescibacteria group bacterium]|nr:hypothetical protein [Patescibacteria group bacterium]
MKKVLKLISKEKSQVKTDNSKAIIFDSGVLINFSMNGITDILKRLRGVFKGNFLITSEIKKEVIDKPLGIKRFKLEALKVKQLFDEGVIELPSAMGVKDSEIFERTKEILDITNSTFEGNHQNIQIMHEGEASCLALSEILNKKGIKNVIAIDERNTRVLIENPSHLEKFLEGKLHVKISRKRENLNFLKDLKVIRSPELVYVAHKKGLLGLNDERALDAILYAVRYKGSTISEEEIEIIKRLG